MFNLNLMPLFALAMFGLACLVLVLLAGASWLFMAVLHLAGAV